jgi:hypothetical protein
MKQIIEILLFSRNRACFSSSFLNLSKSKVSILLKSLYKPFEFSNLITKSSNLLFTITFNCKPQRFLTAGEIPQYFLANGVISNPTPFNAKPLIKVIGTGTIEIQPYKFTVINNDSELWIDSESLEAYKLVDTMDDLTDESESVITDENSEDIELLIERTPENMSSNVSFYNSIYPEIIPGDVPIYLNGDIEEVMIIPRWWRI